MELDKTFHSLLGIAAVIVTAVVGVGVGVAHVKESQVNRAFAYVNDKLEYRFFETFKARRDAHLSKYLSGVAYNRMLGVPSHVKITNNAAGLTFIEDHQKDLDELLKELVTTDRKTAEVMTQMARIRKCPPWLVVLPWTSRLCEIEHEEGVKSSPTYLAGMSYPTVFSFGALLKSVEGDHRRARRALRGLQKKHERRISRS